MKSIVILHWVAHILATRRGIGRGMGKMGRKLAGLAHGLSPHGLETRDTQALFLYPHSVVTEEDSIRIPISVQSINPTQPVCDGTQNVKRYRYFFRYQIFSILIPRLFPIPIFPDTKCFSSLESKGSYKKRDKKRCVLWTYTLWPLNNEWQGQHSQFLFLLHIIKTLVVLSIEPYCKHWFSCFPAFMSLNWKFFAFGSHLLLYFWWIKTKLDTPTQHNP